jgi:hypothetical protein
MFERMDLGQKSDSLAMPVSSSLEKKIHYPSFHLRGDKFKEFYKENDCELGETYTFTGKFKVTSLSEDSGSYELVDISDVQEHEDDDDAAEEAEEKALGYKRPAGNHETPDLDLS